MIIQVPIAGEVKSIWGNLIKSTILADAGDTANKDKCKLKIGAHAA